MKDESSCEEKSAGHRELFANQGLAVNSSL